MGNQTSSKINELEDLIELAEKISVNIDNIRYKVKKSRQNNSILFIILISLCLLGFKYYPDLKDIYNPIISICYLTTVAFLGYLFFQFLHSDIDRKESIKNENLILGDLLNMIHSYKQIVSNDISVVKKAVIDMRLSRIKFNKQSPSNEALLTKGKLESV